MVEPSEKLHNTFAGIKIRSPLGAGAIALPMGRNLTVEDYGTMLLGHVNAGAGYVETLLTYNPNPEVDRERLRPDIPHPIHSGERWFKVDDMEDGGHEIVANMAIIWGQAGGVWTYDFKARIIELLKKKIPEGVAIIASVAQGIFDPDIYIASAKKAEDLGCDAVELALTCSYRLGVDRVVEDYLEQEQDYVDRVVKKTEDIVKAVKIPVGVKLAPDEFGYPRMLSIVKRLEDAGAKFIQASNVAAAIVPPDIYNGGKSRWNHIDGNPFTGVSGTPLRWICYKDIAAIRRCFPELHIASAGGLVKPEHALEIMMLGANQVQFCTGLFFHGNKLITRASQFLEDFMDEYGYKNIEEVIGIAQQYIKPVDKLDLEDVVTEVIQSKCTGCGICYDMICVALEKLPDGNAKVNIDKCSGCALCNIICPEDAMKQVLRSKT